MQMKATNYAKFLKSHRIELAICAFLFVCVCVCIYGWSLFLPRPLPPCWLPWSGHKKKV